MIMVSFVSDDNNNIVVMALYYTCRTVCSIKVVKPTTLIFVSLP